MSHSRTPPHQNRTLMDAGRTMALFHPTSLSPHPENNLSIIYPHKIASYQLREKIGEGTFSEVRIAIDETTGKRYACKIVPKKRLFSDQLESMFENEVRILQKLHHPGISVLYEIYKDTLNYYLILELCPTGCLYDYIFSHKKLSEQEAKFIFKQIAVTLHYIHSNGVIHRDIKPENILINSNNLIIKFIDFGFSKIQFENVLNQTKCGSLSYVSPECLLGNPYDGTASDIWSTGVLLYTMVSGKLPWTKTNQKQLRTEIIEANYFLSPDLSPELQDLLHGILNPEVKLRFSTDDILNHPWLKGVPNPDYSNNEIEQNITDQIKEATVNSFFSFTPPDNVPFKRHYSEGKSLLILTRRRGFSTKISRTSAELILS